MPPLTVTPRFPNQILHVDLPKVAEVRVTVPLSLVRLIDKSVAPFQAGDNRDNVMARAIYALNAIRDSIAEAIASGSKAEWVGFLHTMAVDEDGIPTTIVFFMVRHGRSYANWYDDTQAIKVTCADSSVDGVVDCEVLRAINRQDRLLREVTVQWTDVGKRAKLGAFDSHLK
ncbi:hypothetical protein MFIFM68171_06517 [Madurella fahalii]|uniref:Uncharacterized protein n=1 Tax=Madurella fahalii TaxID=1157608 RepID=A0ABQ0GEW8_9PEZI